MTAADTIVAISTPCGEGGIGIVRISGSEAFKLGMKLFMPHRKKKNDYPVSHHLYHGYIKNEQGESVDEVLVAFMRGPHTYTCEDTVEINCHSGIFNLRIILNIILNSGARLAEPGEFTKRAFLNGRIDLSQAESVLNLIRARSEEGVKIAVRNVNGHLAQEMTAIRNNILDMLAQIEAVLEFPEDIYDEVSQVVENLKPRIQEIKRSLKRLLKGAERGRAYQDGINTAIIGKPNVGKSSLLNALLRQERAIVHEIPGTTRDLLEGYLYIQGYPIRIIDTAGIRKTLNPVEIEGIGRSKGAAERARLILLVLDSSSPWSSEDEAAVRMIRADQEAIFVLNKADLPEQLSATELKDRFRGIPIVKTALVNNQGIRELEEEIARLLDKNLGYGGESAVMVGLRHEEVIRKALISTEKAATAVVTQPLELVSMELNEAWCKLGEITGDTVTDELLDRIFSQFCIGK